MKRAAIVAGAWLGGVVVYWLFWWAADLVAHLHWTTPADWTPKLRFNIFVGGCIAAAAPAIWAFIATTPRPERGEAGR